MGEKILVGLLAVLVGVVVFALAFAATSALALLGAAPAAGVLWFTWNYTGGEWWHHVTFLQMLAIVVGVNSIRSTLVYGTIPSDLFKNKVVTGTPKLPLK